MVLKAHAVILAPLPAILLEEASYGSTTGVLDVTTPVRDLEPLELNDGGDIGVDGALRKEGPLRGRLYSRREGYRGYIALVVIREELCDLSERDL